MKNLYQKISIHYDSIYRWKDYENDVVILEEFFRKSEIMVKQILDVACGTGNHDLLLARKGYRITGIDSTAEMLAIAKKKVRNAIFRESDMKDFVLNHTFDAVICLFSSINYNLDLRELEKTLRNFYRHLKPKGICIFDTWILKKNFRNRLNGIGYTDEDFDIVRFGYSKATSNSRTSTSLYLIRDRGKLQFCTDSAGHFLPSEILALMRKIGFNSSEYKIVPHEIFDSNATRKVDRNFFVGIKV